jgi:hypothetical protein
MASNIPPPSEISRPRKISADLELLRRGELSEAEYLDRRIEIAMAHVRGLISKNDYALIREMMVTMLNSDPILVEMKMRVLEKTYEKP